MKKFLKLASLNLLIAFLGYLVLFFVVSAGYDIWRNVGRPLVRPYDKRADSPAYVDREKARRILANQKETEKYYVPFVEWRQSPMKTENLNVNAEGNRIHTVGLNNRPDAVTLGMFGASTMWGTGVDDNSTIAAFFDQATDRFNVTNYGERGHTSRQNIDLLINLIVEKRPPQIVVFYNGGAEIWAHCNLAVTESLNGHSEERWIRELIRRDNNGQIYKNFVMPVLGVLAHIGGQRVAQDEFVCDTSPARAEAVAGMMVKNWEIAKLLVESYGGKFYVFLQPNFALGAPKTDYLKLSKSDQAQGRQFQAIHPIVLRLLAEKRIDYVYDLTKALDGNTPYLIDYVHLGPAGNKVIAEQMAKTIAAQ